jgi:hypothetical protein
MGEEKALISKVDQPMARFVALMIAIVLAAASFPALGAQDSAEEYAVKAAFLYNFARFTEWPSEVFPEKDSPIIVCVFGDDPFGETIDFLREKTIHGRPVLLKREKDLEELQTCHVLFVSSSKRNQLDQILGRTEGWSVLTVSDMDNFAHKGGNVGFVNQNNKIRFEVDPESTKEAGLRLSSKLLSLALIVGETTHFGSN